MPAGWASHAASTARALENRSQDVRSRGSDSSSSGQDDGLTHEDRNDGVISLTLRLLSSGNSGDQGCSRGSAKQQERREKKSEERRVRDESRSDSHSRDPREDQMSWGKRGDAEAEDKTGTETRTQKDSRRRR